MKHEKIPMVLVVDDDKYTRGSIMALLSKWGIETDEAENGNAAIKKMKEKKYSLILLDMKMGEKSGLDVLQEMKSCNITVPVILITAYPHDERIEKAIEYNIDLLFKPVDPAELKNTIRQYIKI